MTKRSDFEWDSDKDELNQEKHGVPLPWLSLLFWIIIVSSWKIWNTVMMKSGIIVLAESPVEL